MIEIRTTGTFDRLFLDLPVSVQRKADRKAKMFRHNPFDPSLRTEKLHPKARGHWSFRVDLRYRIVLKFIGSGVAEFRFIGHHHEIYDYDALR